jgi:transposase-like protein
MTQVSKRRSRYDSKVLRSYWSIHIEAWIRTGVTREQYCREHRLDRQTMVRWLTALETPPQPPRRVYKKHVIVKGPRLPALRTKAFFAFWSMHVEAHRLSGLNATQYAQAQRLAVIRFRRVRRRFELNPLAQNWHDLYHPATPSPHQLDANLRDKLRDDLCISQRGGTVQAAAAPGPSRRRQYTDRQKLAIVAEFAEPGVTASIIARRHGVTASMIFRWRDEFSLSPKRQESAMLVTARVIERPGRGRPKKNLPLVLPDLLPIPQGAVTVELADGRRVFAPAGSDPEVVRQYIAQREATA